MVFVDGGDFPKSGGDGAPVVEEVWGGDVGVVGTFPAAGCAEGFLPCGEVVEDVALSQAGLLEEKIEGDAFCFVLPDDAADGCQQRFLCAGGSFLR